MDKDKLKAILTEVVEDQLSKKVRQEDSEFSTAIQDAVQKSVTKLQESLVGNPIPDNEINKSDQIIRDVLPYHKMLGENMLVTHQGSVLDLSRKHTPWVKCSKEVEDWASEFCVYLNTRGKVVGKVLQETEDPSGGYELYLMGYGAYHRGQ